MKRGLVILVMAGLLIFATSAIAAAENGPRWPVVTIYSQAVR
jgi:hypothetical protein